MVTPPHCHLIDSRHCSEPGARTGNLQGRIQEFLEVGGGGGGEGEAKGLNITGSGRGWGNLN